MSGWSTSDTWWLTAAVLSAYACPAAYLAIWRWRKRKGLL